MNISCQRLASLVVRALFMTVTKFPIEVIPRRLFLLSFLLVISINGHSQTLKEESKLFDKPNGTALGASVPGKAPVKILERQGFWIRVEAGGRAGWLKASSLNFSSNPSGPTAIDTGRLGTGNIVSTSAARGLSAKDILAGVPKVQEVHKMQKYVPTEAELKLFSSQGNIVASKQAIEVKSLVSLTSQSVSQQKASGAAGTQSPKSVTKKATDDW